MKAIVLLHQQISCNFYCSFHFEPLCREQIETSQENTNPYEALGSSCQNEKYNPNITCRRFLKDSWKTYEL